MNDLYTIKIIWDTDLTVLWENLNLEDKEKLLKKIANKENSIWRDYYKDTDSYYDFSTVKIAIATKQSSKV